MTAASYFSADYDEARAKFIEAARAAGANLTDFMNPNSGPSGGPLYTDVAILGARDATSKLVLGSATHGVEGFCGSGIQTGLLREGIASEIGGDLAVIMIHAINPFGFAHLRRANEDNVDVNRNFIDHSIPHPENPEYDALADVVAPKNYSITAGVRSLLRLKLYQALHGKAALQAAISGGQYRHPEGLFFGGQFETWSNKTIHEIARRHLAGATRVAFVDFHTGLGPHSYGEIISHDLESSLAFRRIEAWWGERAKSAKVGKSVSPELSGTVKLAFSQMLPEAEVTGVSLEFGTEPLQAVIRALQAENWLYHHGGPSHPSAGKIKAAMRRVFYPDSDEWKAQVWAQGKEVVEQAVTGLSE